MFYKIARLALLGLIVAALLWQPSEKTNAQGSNAWFPQSGVCGGCVDTTWTFSNLTGDIAQISWFGTAINIQGTTDTNRGFIQVSIDAGAFSSPIDTYSSSSAIVFWYTSATLPEAQHTATIYVDGTHSGSASDSYAALDGAYLYDNSSSPFTFVDDFTTATSGNNAWHFFHYDHFPNWRQDFDFTSGSTWTWITHALSGFTGDYYNAGAGYWQSANFTCMSSTCSGVDAQGTNPFAIVDSSSGILDLQVVGNDVDASSLASVITIENSLASSTFSDVQTSPGAINVFHYFFTMAGASTNQQQEFQFETNSPGKTFQITHFILQGWGNNPWATFTGDTATPTPSLTPTATNTVATNTFTPSSTFTPSETFTPSLTPSPTATFTPSLTNTAMLAPAAFTPTPAISSCGLFNYCGFLPTPSPYPSEVSTSWISVSQLQEQQLAQNIINDYRGLDNNHLFYKFALAFIILLVIYRVFRFLNNRLNDNGGDDGTA